MKLLEDIPVVTTSGNKYIQLYHGDLTAMRSPVDLLIISAGPKDYMPTPGSLIGALHRKGVVVARLARTKELDLHGAFSCWLSRPVDSSSHGIGFRRLLCVEPRSYSSISELVSGFFRSLIAVLSSGSYGQSAAMPIVFSGGAGLPVSLMTKSLIDGAVHWMALGLPLQCLKIVVYNEAEAREAAEAFLLRKSRYRDAPFGSRSESTYDIFLSYASRNANDAELIISSLLDRRPEVAIFWDRRDLKVGGVWQHQLFLALDACTKIVALLSPDYIRSDFCIEEFNIAMLRGRSEGKAVLYPIYLYSTGHLPTYMTARQFSDCREGDAVKLSATCNTLVTML